MGEGQEENLQASCLLPIHDKHAKHEDQWMIMESGDDDIYNTFSLDDSSTTTTDGSTSSSDMVDDASSSSCSSSNSNNGPLFELSELMEQLPIKRGLSKYYKGKSQSFASLSKITSIEELAKKEVPYRRKMKASKSYGNGLDAHKSYTLPKATIFKKVSKTHLSSLPFPGRRGNFLSSSRPPLFPLRKKFDM